MKFLQILVALAILCTPALGQTTTIFDSWNKGSVDNNPTGSTSFTIFEPHMITYIDTYHWNYGQGTSSGGTISLKKEDGETFGPWTVTAESGSGAANAWWISHPDMVIPAGTYSIIDSEPETWSKNSESNDCGFSKVEGHPEKAAEFTPDSGKETEAALTTDEALGNKENKIRVVDEVEPRSKYLTDSELDTLHNFGKELLNNAPPEIRNGGDLAKARYAYTEYCSVLAKGGAPVNADYWTRFQNLIINQDPGRWTCGFHEDSLNQIFNGMGLGEKIVELEAQREGIMPEDVSKMTDPNFNHIAIAIKAEGDIFVFDPWQQALNSKNGDYSGAEESMWNGMPASVWGKILREKQQYIQFTDNGGNNWYDSTAPIVEKYYPKSKKDLEVPNKDAEDWYNKGIDIFNQYLDFEGAINAYDEAIRLNPNYADAWNARSVALSEQDKYDESLKAIDEALRIDSNNAKFWHNRGIILKNLGRTLDADAAYAKAKDLGYTG
jgi:tetratricopeptide (TPR) repeat protein